LPWTIWFGAFNRRKAKERDWSSQVMGASLWIFDFGFQDFVNLHLVSIVIAMPLACTLRTNWLDPMLIDNLSWWIFVASGILLI